MTDAWSRDEGPKESTVYVSFGPKPTQVLSVEVAGGMLALWWEREPHRFGEYLAEVMTGTRPGRNRRQ